MATCPYADGDQEAFHDVVNALREEVRGLRRSALLHAVIEQAKGMLIQRDGITADAAFVVLRKMSQEHNVRLVEVAATVVGIAFPPAEDGDLAGCEVVARALPDSISASPAWRELSGLPEIRAGVIGAVLDVLAAGTRRGEDAAELLGELLTPFDVAAVTLYRHVADDSLHLVGQVGIAPDLVSSWVHIPPTAAIPDVAVVRSALPTFWSSAQQRRDDYPAVGGMAATFQATAAIPVLEGGAVIGVVGLMWDSEGLKSPQQTKAIVRLVQRVAPILLRDVAPADPELQWLELVLRLHSDPYVLMEILPKKAGSSGVVEDFVIVEASASVPGSGDLRGRRMLEAWPSALTDGISGALSSLSLNGGSWTYSVGRESQVPWGKAGTRVSAARLGRKVVLVWTPPHHHPD